MKRLEGKVALVTAGGSGLGRHISRALVREGCAVAICSRRMSVLEEAIAEFESMGGHALAIQTDISVENQVEAMVKQIIDTFGKIDVLVNNTGTPGPICKVVDMDIEAWKKTIDVDVTGTLLVSKEVLKYMIPQGTGGSIIMVGAQASTIAEGWGGFPLRASYMACKNAMIGMQGAMAAEVGKYGIRVNSVRPAAIESDRMMQIMKNYADNKGTSIDEEITLEKSHYTLRKITKPEEVASCVVFLASDESSAITNDILNCSSGMALKAPDVV